MSEKLPHSFAEHTETSPKMEEILSTAESIAQGELNVLRVLEDAHGPYYLEASTVDEAGGLAVYTYMRAGQFPGRFSTETVIDVVFYDGDTPVGGHVVAKFKSGAWVYETG